MLQRLPTVLAQVKVGNTYTKRILYLWIQEIDYIKQSATDVFKTTSKKSNSQNSGSNWWFNGQ